MSVNFINYGYNNEFVNMYFYNAPTAALTLSTAPSSTVANYNVVTKTFFALIDVTITSTKLASRLFFRLDK